jgi:hypothetical protein
VSATLSSLTLLAATFAPHPAGAEPPPATANDSLTRASGPPLERARFASLLPRIAIGCAVADTPGLPRWAVEGYLRLSWPLDTLPADARTARVPVERGQIGERALELWRRRQTLARDTARALSVEDRLDLDETQAELEALDEGAP